MKKINRLAWIALASLSLLVGLWVLLAEGVSHSKFYVFFVFSILVFFFLYFKRFSGGKITKRKKSR